MSNLQLIVTRQSCWFVSWLYQSVNGRLGHAAVCAVAAWLVVAVSCDRAPAPKPVGPAQLLSSDTGQSRSLAGPQSTGNQLGIKVPPTKRALDSEFLLFEKYDPAQDEGWHTEVLSDAAKKQLKIISHLLESNQAIDPEQLRPLIQVDFKSQLLRPVDLVEVYNSEDLVVRRWNPSESVLDAYQGVSGFAQALEDLSSVGKGAKELRAQLKIFRIEQTEQHFVTRVLVETSARLEDRGVQQNARWRCSWAYPRTQDNASPRLQSIQLEQYEQIETVASGGVWFSDCTESAIASNSAYAEQVLPSINHWLARFPRQMGTTIFSLHGLSVGDVNGDGLEDLYVCDGGGLPNRLYLQNMDGTVRDVSSESGVDWLEYTASALLIDLDNDGDQDLVIASNPDVVFAENDGQGKFTLRNQIKAVFDAVSLSAVDYNRDGHLDVFVCGYMPSSQDNKGLPGPVPYHDANNGGPNALLRNDGNFQFTDVTDETGLGHNNSRFSFASTWDDFDNDGDMDLYIANDYGRNNLYRNDDGLFSDVAGEAGVEDQAAGMSAAWGDYNRDGWMDLYVGNMFSGAGGRVTYQRNFGGGRQELGPHAQRMARGNSLFSNRSDGAFDDVSELATVMMGRWAWSSIFTDLNNDSWPDLLVANGYVTNEDSGDL